MSIYYDLHIHSALSPCGDNDMTPNNIVNMSVLKGLDVIAITDHNSARNARACWECGQSAGVIVLPGMEIETLEEVHLLALFAHPDPAEELDKIVAQKLPDIKNRTDIFGEQYVFDAQDNIVYSVSNLLSTATALSLSDAAMLVRDLGGVAVPAHVDKSSYSVISNLGFIPDELDFSVLEIKFSDRKEEFMARHKLSSYKVIHSSDAHFLWDINEREYFLDINPASGTEIIDYLKQKP